MVRQKSHSVISLKLTTPFKHSYGTTDASATTTMEHLGESATTPTAGIIPSRVGAHRTSGSAAIRAHAEISTADLDVPDCR